jgi:chemotaxis protein MotA
VKTVDDIETVAATLVSLSIRAHRRGLMAVEEDADQIADPFLREGVLLVADAESAETLKEWLALESETREADDEAPARVFEAAAGYAPTLGILGAVLGLAQVMQKLSAPGVLGSEIAVAFVATIYGVGLANLVLLPVAGRIRERAAAAARRRDMIAQALCAIRSDMHPRLVAQKLRAYAASLPRIEELATRVGSRRAAARDEELLRPSAVPAPPTASRIPA